MNLHGRIDFVLSKGKEVRFTFNVETYPFIVINNSLCHFVTATLSKEGGAAVAPFLLASILTKKMTKLFDETKGCVGMITKSQDSTISNTAEKSYMGQRWVVVRM